jgi:hypothetical protein
VLQLEASLQDSSLQPQGILVGLEQWYCPQRWDNKIRSFVKAYNNVSFKKIDFVHLCNLKQSAS